METPAIKIYRNPGDEENGYGNQTIKNLRKPQAKKNMWTPSTNESIKPLAEAKFRCLREGKLKKIQVLIAKQTLPMRIPSNASDGTTA